MTRAPSPTMLDLVRRCRTELGNAERAMRALAAHDAMAVRNPLFRWRRNAGLETANCNAARAKAVDAIVLATTRLFHEVDQRGHEQTRSIASALRAMLATVSAPTKAGASPSNGCPNDAVSDEVLAQRIERIDQRLTGIVELTGQRLPATFSSPSIVRGLSHPAGVLHIEENIASLLDRASLRALKQVSAQHARIASAEQQKRLEQLRKADVDTLRGLLHSLESARVIFNDEQLLAKVAEGEQLVSRTIQLGMRLFWGWGTVVDRHPGGWEAGVKRLILNRPFMLSLCRSPEFDGIECAFLQSSFAISGFDHALRTILPALTDGPDALPKDHPSIRSIAGLLAGNGLVRALDHVSRGSVNASAANDASQ